ncbi:MAG: DUF4294 domain-containing protein [Chitinophagales bacterium]|nr:DUF4294 domain-containing protein [Bacteroidota bacterium]MCB9042183.1 DUF4294 domain-containing protein [Chitinophagales bacterium]
MYKFKKIHLAVLVGVFILLGVQNLVAQTQTYRTDDELIALLKKKDTKVLEGIILEDDTLAYYDLPEVNISANKLTNRERFLYNKMKRDVLKVYPYVTKVSALITEVEDTTASMDKKRMRKRYVNDLENTLKDQFKDELKNLTVNQGKVMIELIERNTNRTFYDILDDYKSKFSLFFYETIGKKYGYDFKTPYNPDDNPLLELVVREVEGSSCSDAAQ